MDEKDKMIDELRSQMEKLQEDFVALKYNYNEEKRSYLELSERLKRIRTDKVKLIAERNNLQERVDNFETEVEALRKVRQKFQPIKVQKLWKNLKVRGKLKRKAQYKDMIDSSLRYITECKRAKMTLTIGEEDINFKWTENEMSNHHKEFDIVLLPECEASSDEGSDRNSEPNSEANVDNTSSTHEVFDGDCNFSKRHKRTIIAVMDNHRMSHKAYHVIRKAGKGNWPSLTMIKKEKAKMSKEIPFSTDQEVRFQRKNSTEYSCST